MSVLINSAKLARRVWIAESREEARQLWKDHPKERGSIYLASELEAMQGVNLETLQAIQAVKDVFLGAQVVKGVNDLLDQNNQLQGEVSV